MTIALIIDPSSNEINDIYEKIRFQNVIKKRQIFQIFLFGIGNVLCTKMITLYASFRRIKFAYNIYPFHFLKFTLSLYKHLINKVMYDFMQSKRM